MAAYLAGAASGAHQAFVVASHSPELMNAPIADVIEVRREQDKMVLMPLGRVERRTLEELGLSPSDLLRRQRAFLLVEGLHEELVLDEMLGRTG